MRTRSEFLRGQAPAVARRLCPSRSPPGAEPAPGPPAKDAGSTTAPFAHASRGITGVTLTSEAALVRGMTDRQADWESLLCRRGLGNPLGVPQSAARGRSAP